MYTGRPLVHLNGTSKRELVETRIFTAQKIAEALTALQKTAPHMRDYYPLAHAEEEYKAACREYTDRERSLQDILLRLRDEVEAIEEEHENPKPREY